MAWFKNDKPRGWAGLQDLPPLSLPNPLEVQEEKEISEEKIPSLPTFPLSSIAEKISRDTVKQLIQQNEEREEETEESQLVPKTFEMGEPLLKEEKATIKGPIFVQIEKYHDVLKDLEEAKNKVDKISHILKEVKKLKEDEENEISEWEKEILNVKENLERVDQTIFKKLK